MNRLVLTFAAVCALGVSTMAQAPRPPAKAALLRAAVEDFVRQGWQDFKDQKKDAYGADLADDATQVWADNKPPRDKATALKDMMSYKLDSYTLSNMQITMLGPDAAVATYMAKVMFSGEKAPHNLAVTDIVVRRGGQWKDLRYQESEIK